ncbi:MAG: hypothetical protein R8F89_14800 [Roseobacter sp.]|nr:hypothetical protein [Roseobacter sp.]
MTDASRSRAESGFATMFEKITLTRLVRWLRPRPKGLHIGDISDHLARDIGLSKADLERLRLTLPSQTDHHPRG